MRVYKFGGASVQDAAGVSNLAQIVAQAQDQPLVVVISAMGKTTNALEKVWQSWLDGDVSSALKAIETVKNQHHLIVREAFLGLACETVINDINQYFNALEALVKNDPSDNPNFDYDRVVSTGEMVSTRIVAQYLDYKKMPCTWLDSARIIKTNSRYRSATIDWQRTVTKCQQRIQPKAGEIVVTQGFLGANAEGQRTTLGREGSDFSGAILAYALDANSLTIWKDVAGLLNADPRIFQDTQKLEEISYREALELSYYGASVIHPKTIKPLQNKNIPLYIKPFNAPHEAGTTVHHKDTYDADIPSYIIKPKQRLVSITPRDFSFVVEENLMHLFGAFNQHGITANLMQNSAISFSICVDEEADLRGLINDLSDRYEVRYNEQVSLTTIRHYNDTVIDQLTTGKKILLEQRTRNTVRFVCG